MPSTPTATKFASRLYKVFVSKYFATPIPIMGFIPLKAKTGIKLKSSVPHYLELSGVKISFSR